MTRVNQARTFYRRIVTQPRVCTASPSPLPPSPLEALDPLRKEILTLQPALFRPDRFQAHSWIGKCFAAKIATALYRISKGNFGDMKAVGAGVFERRVDFGTGYRIYFAQDGDELVVLLVGGTKKRQSADIAEAKRRWGHYKRRKQTEG